MGSSLGIIATALIITVVIIVVIEVSYPMEEEEKKNILKIEGLIALQFYIPHNARLIKDKKGRIGHFNIILGGK